MKRFFLLWTCISIFSSYTVLAQYDDLIQKTESPYFFIKNEGSAVEQFPLLSTQVRVEVVGPIADVLVEQTYRNNGSVPIEATYVFPASTRAAVYDLEMVIGERRIKAEIKEKEEARLKYEEAKQEGKRASLLEQERPNVFQMNVANIMPGDLIKVVLRYNEFIIPEKQQYAFVFPTVVGPRYVSSRNPGVHESFAANPYLSNGQDVPYSFDIQIALSPGVPITTINSPSHQIDINFENLNKASARLSAQEKKGGNRDFILQYTLSGDGISSGTILYEHGDENFFLTTIEPPKLKPETQILPREYLFVVDVSGSMYGFPIETTKQLMKDLISKLRSNDLFNLILFAGDNTILSPVSLPANEQYLQLAFEAIDHLQGSGSTEIIPALKRIFSIPKINKDLSRSIVVVTDGYVSVEPEVFEMISEHIGDGNVFAFGIGGGVNRFLIEGIAHAGRGEAFVVTKPEMASEAASKFRNYVEHPIMTNITYRFSGFDAYDVIPAAIPDLMAERPLYIFGKYRGKANGSLVLNGRQAGKDFEERIDINSQLSNTKHAALRYLWAREKIRWNSDFIGLTADEKRKQKITQLGLTYNLLTDYTSFVAIDEIEKVNSDGVVTRIKQPLPLPQNVSNYAVGFEMEIDGVSVANKIPAKLNLSALVLEGQDPLKRTLTEEFNRAISMWDESWQNQWMNKKLVIDVAQTLTESKIYLDGFEISGSRRRAILQILNSLKEVLAKGDRIVIKFVRRP